MNRLMRPTLLAFVVSLVVWGLIAVWDADPRAVSSWLLTWQRIAVVVAIVSGLVMLALLVYAAWERLTRYCRLVLCHVGFYLGNRAPSRSS
jgi:Co/Zn/Cd efflux system component